MRKKFIFKAVLLALAVLLLIAPLAVFADSYLYYTEITITDTSGTSRSNVPALIPISGTALYNAGFINVSGTDTRMKEGATDESFLMVSSQVATFLPTLAAYQSRTYNLYTGYDPLKGVADPFEVITGTGGYITTLDNPLLELSNAGAAANFTIDQKGYIDTTAGSNKNLVYKQGAAQVYISNVDEITASLGVEAQPIVGGSSDTVGIFTPAYNSLMGGGWWSATESTVYQCIPTSGEINFLHIRLSVNVPGGCTFTFTLMVNSAPSALTVTIPAGASTGSDLTHSVSVTAGQTVSLRATYTGAPGALGANWSTAWVPTIAGESICLVNMYSTIANATNGEIQGWVNLGVTDANEVRVQAPIPTAGTFKKLYVQLSASPGAGADAYSFTLRKVAADTALTCTITQPATTGNDAVNMVAVVAGDLVDIRINPLNVPAAAPTCAIGMVFVSSTSGESLVMGGSWNSTPAINATRYLNFCGTGETAWNATENLRYSLTQGGLLKNLYVNLSVAPGGATSYTVSIQEAGGPTGLSVTVTGAATTGNDTISIYNSVAGDTVDTKCVTTIGAAAAYVHWGVVYLTKVSVSATGVASGVRQVVVQATGGGTNLFTINVYDDAGVPVGVAGSVPLDGFIVPDNNNSWLINQNNVMPYMEYLKITTAVAPSGEKLWYQPIAMISGTTLPDRDGTQNGTITWGANSNLTVTIGDTTPYASTSAAVVTGGDIDMITAVDQPANWYGTASTITSLPFYSTFNDAATSIGMPVKTLYQIIMLGTASAIGLGVLVFTGSGLVAGIVAAVVIGAGVTAGGGVLGGWMVLTFLILGLGVLYLWRMH